MPEGSAEHPPNKLVSAAELAQAVPIHSIVGDRLNMIAQLRQSQTKVNLQALQQISRAREAALVSLRFPGLAVNLLMLVGLLGTFVGIAIVIQQIGLNINQGDASLQSFGKVFSGMYTKFSTTLAGLACAIVLAWLNFRLSQAQERFFEELDRFTVGQLLPATIPALDEDTLLERVSQQLETSFGQIEEIAKRTAKTTEEISAMQSGFSAIIDNIRQQTKSQGLDQLQTLLGQVTNVIGQISRVNDGLQTLTTELPRALKESNRELLNAQPAPARPVEQQHRAAPEHKLPYAAGFLAFGAAVVILFITIVIRG